MDKYKASSKAFILRKSLALTALIFAVFALQCTHTSSPNSELQSEEHSLSAESKRDLIHLEYAKNFRVYVQNNDTIIEVKDGKKIWKKKAKKLASSYEIKVPIDSFINLSTSHLYYFNEINGLNGLKAVSFADHIKDTMVVEALENGSLLNLSRGSEYDSELILEIQPELFTTYPFGNNEFSRLEDAGIRTLHFTEYTENHPLGRVEWVKLAGFLVGRESEAEDYFQKVKDAYLITKLKGLAKKSARPKVINANGFENEWTAPNGKSIVANFINDAGGDYVFRNDTSSGNLTLDFERLCILADSADWWGSVVFSEDVNLETFTGEDERLKNTNVMKRQAVFYCNAKENDYFGRGIIEPHLMLEDLYQIFYSDSLGYVPHYFEKLAE